MSSTIQVDSIVIPDYFRLSWQTPRSGRVELEAFTGSLYPFVQFNKKDVFTVTFLKMSQDLRDQMENLITQTGAGALHTVEYTTPNGRSVTYDGVSSSGLSDSSFRVHQKMYVREPQFDHYRGMPNIYTLTAQFVEV